jgi:predicted transcriptional regulator
MSKENTLMIRMDDDLHGTVQTIADARFEGNRSAAIRWMLHQSRITPEVAAELARQEAERPQ